MFPDFKIYTAVKLLMILIVYNSVWHVNSGVPQPLDQVFGSPKAEAVLKGKMVIVAAITKVVMNFMIIFLELLFH